MHERSSPHALTRHDVYNNSWGCLPLGAWRSRDMCRDILAEDVPAGGHGGGSSATFSTSYSLWGPLMETPSWDSGSGSDAIALLQQ
ncbi:hypothetical protein Syun_020751 [Stephania yunnanensis]|uniref:Uncharacterized protein n=1 Tax=Stephania yunnanensis TaxID=152371 RepID=A0AAP0IEC7_9MAGN